MTCRKCNKPLSNFTSIKLGIGVICRKKIEQGEGQMEMFNTNADFSIEKETESFIYIKDTGNHSEHRTITNDPEFVVKELYKQYNLENKRIFYMDIVWKNRRNNARLRKIYRFQSWTRRSTTMKFSAQQRYDLIKAIMRDPTVSDEQANKNLVDLLENFKQTKGQDKKTGRKKQ